jgi:large subunit ribosomal protein L6e
MAPSSKLSQGIKKASRSHAYHRRGLWAIKAKHGGAFPKAEKPAAVAEPKFYPADDVKPRKPSTRKPKPTKLRYLRGLHHFFSAICLPSASSPDGL